MSSEVFNLAIILSLKDAASGGLDRFQTKLRAAGKEGKQFAETLDDIRAEMNKGLAIGGIGVASLGLMYQGVKVAANFQSSVTDLKTTFSQLGKDGQVNLDILGKNMLRAEGIAIRLGNALPGTTEDVLKTIQVLKQNGLQTETILNGAADAVYNLAVANNELSTDTAKNFAQFGQLFNLKPDEYIKAADVVSRLYTSSGIASGELVEAAKYFQGRSGAAIGLTGLKDAEQTMRLIGLMRKQGLEGTQAGTALNNFFSGYTSHEKALKALEKDTGIKLKFFDEKGAFAGIDNLFKQLEPLQKLSEEERTIRLKAIFGEEGMSAATAILKTGADGWKQYNEEQNKTISLQQKNLEKSKDFNNQMEALTGSVKNLVVTGFTPLLPQLTSAINSTNTFVGSVQTFGKEHPVLVDTLATFALYGSTALVVVGGFKAMTSAWKMFTLVSSVSRGGGILQYLQQTNVAANNTTTSLTTATTKAKGLKGIWQNLANSSALKLGVDMAAVVAAELVVTALVTRLKEVSEAKEKLLEGKKNINISYDEMMGRGLLWNKPGDYKGRVDLFDAQADKLLQAMNVDRLLELSLNPERKTAWEQVKLPFFMAPFGMTSDQNTSTGAKLDPKVAAQRFREIGITASMQDPNQLARLISRIEGGGGDLKLNQEGIKLLLQTLQEIVGKEKMNAAQGILGKENSGNNQTAMPQKSLYDLFYKPNSFNYLNNPFKNPLQEKPLFDQNKTPTQFFTSLEQLKQPIGSTAQTFSNLATNSKTWLESMTAITTLSKNTPDLYIKMNQSLVDLISPISDTKEKISNLGETSGKVVTPLGNVATSANRASVNLDTFSNKLGNWQPPNIQVPSVFSVPSGNNQSGISNTFKLGGYATGGKVLGKGLAYIHADEEIIPASVSRKYSGGIKDIANSAFSGKTENQPFILHYNPQITINGGGKNAKKEFQEMLAESTRQLEHKMAKILRRGRIRS